nr:unnamed protein product [Digitaria exilis]
MKGRFAVTTALIFVLLTFGAEAKECESPSATFIGGKSGGHCAGVVFRRKCMCTESCEEARREIIVV